MNLRSGVRAVASASVVLTASLLLTACEAENVEEESEALVDQLRAIEGVSSVDFTYEDLGGWEADEIEYVIDLEPSTDSEAVGEVAGAVYAAVRDGDIDDAAVSADLRLADDQISLRIYESTADADEIARVTSAVVPQLERGRTHLEVDTSMRGADEALDLSVNQILETRPTEAEAIEAEAAWQRVIDSVGRGGAFVGGPGTYGRPTRPPRGPVPSRTA